MAKTAHGERKLILNLFCWKRNKRNKLKIENICCFSEILYFKWYWVVNKSNAGLILFFQLPGGVKVMHYGMRV